jgi:hypothetical protein
MLNIDFDSCASMLFYSGYSMDPNTHAALMPTTGSITGKVVDASTQQPIAGNVIIALEQLDSDGVDREIMQAASASDGSFVLCPLPPGVYDVVATAVATTGVSYAATITAGINPGSSLGTVPLRAIAGGNQSLAALQGQITATGPDNVGGFSHLVISALQHILINGAPVLVTIPLASQYTSTFRTLIATNNTYKLNVPAGNPLVGSFSSTGSTNYQQGSASPVTYEVDVQSSCSPAIVRTPAVSVSPGKTSAAPVSLVGCPPA